jgi:hypothetical protein
MTGWLSTISPRLQARLAGALYLYIVVAGVFAEGFVRGQLVVSGDALATAANIRASEMLYRSGVAIEIVMNLCDVGVALLLYNLLSAVDPTLSRLAAWLRLIVVAISGVKALLLMAPLYLLSGAPYLDGLQPGGAETLTLLAFRLHGAAYNIALVFFGICCLAKGWLVWRSDFLPRILGPALAIAGACYLVNSFAGILAPAFASSLFPFILLPCLLAELALTLWLLIRGVDAAKWARQAASIGLA